MIWTIEWKSNFYWIEQVLIIYRFKLPDSKKARRYKRRIYSEQFTSIGEFEKNLQNTKSRIDEYNRRDTQGEIRFFTDKQWIYWEKLNIFNLNIKEELKQQNKYQLKIMGIVNLVILIISTDILFFFWTKSNQKIYKFGKFFNLQYTKNKIKIHQSTNKRIKSKPRQNNNIHQIKD